MNDLCGVCGASWACEHRALVAAEDVPAAPAHVIYDADSRGNVTESRFEDRPRRFASLPRPSYTREELEERIAAIVLSRRRTDVSDLMGRLGYVAHDREASKDVNNAVNRLVRRKVIYKGRSLFSSGKLFPYSIETHRGEVRYLLQYIDESEVGYAKRELRLAQERIDRLYRKRGALAKELAGLETTPEGVRS